MLIAVAECFMWNRLVNPSWQFQSSCCGSGRGLFPHKNADTFEIQNQIHPNAAKCLHYFSWKSASQNKCKIHSVLMVNGLTIALVRKISVVAKCGLRVFFDVMKCAVFVPIFGVKLIWYLLLSTDKWPRLHSLNYLF